MHYTYYEEEEKLEDINNRRTGFGRNFPNFESKIDKKFCSTGNFYSNFSHFMFEKIIRKLFFIVRVFDVI